MVRLRVQAEHHGVRDESRNALVRTVRLENLVIDSRQIVLTKTVDRFRCPQYRFANPIFIERHQRAVAFLHFDDAVLDRHKSAFLVWRL